jgi:hypothetical protein
MDSEEDKNGFDPKPVGSQDETSLCRQSGAPVPQYISYRINENHYCTPQSQETAETPPTPGSGADGTPVHALGDLLLSYPMINGEGHEKLLFQGLDQDYQGISTRRYPDYD